MFFSALSYTNVRGNLEITREAVHRRRSLPAFINTSSYSGWTVDTAYDGII